MSYGMFQDISPYVFHNEYSSQKPQDDDILIVQRGRDILVSRSGADAAGNAAGGNEHGDCCGPTLPTVARVRTICPQAAEQAYYLLSVDKTHFFCSDIPVPETEDLVYNSVMVLREMDPGYMGFAGSVSWQLASWYDLHRYCGRCGTRTEHSEKERAIICPECGHTYYPRISPVVIIAIVDGDRILLTRYSRGGYRRHSLVAGFVEIGETLEDAVCREVMEEVGLHVKNIRYCESQPWPFSSSLIAGFFADVDGDPTVHLNTDGQDELAEGVWVSRDELVMEDSGLSLTWDMIRKFRDKTFL